MSYIGSSPPPPPELDESGAVLDIANPIDPIDRSIRILNQVVAMERDEALRRPRWCGWSKSRDLL